MTIRVLIADDHAPIRAGVREALEGAGFVICAEVVSGPTAVEAARAEQPDVCLLDVEMPGSGLHAVRGVLDAAPHTQVLMLTVSGSAEDLADALKAGANGYLVKSVSAAGLVDAVRSAAAGHVVLSQDLQATLLRQFRGAPNRKELRHAQGGVVTLTPREWDVMELLCQQLPTSEIGKRLFLRPATVRRHVADVVHKFRVHSRDDAVKLFRQHTS